MQCAFIILFIWKLHESCVSCKERGDGWKCLLGWKCLSKCRIIMVPWCSDMFIMNMKEFHWLLIFYKDYWFLSAFHSQSMSVDTGHWISIPWTFSGDINLQQYYVDGPATFAIGLTLKTIQVSSFPLLPRLCIVTLWSQLFQFACWLTKRLTWVTLLLGCQEVETLVWPIEISCEETKLFEEYLDNDMNKSSYIPRIWDFEIVMETGVGCPQRRLSTGRHSTVLLKVLFRCRKTLMLWTVLQSMYLH